MALGVGRYRRAYRRTWQRITRAYSLACARDDTAARGLTVPSGVWACRRCPQVLLELTALRAHLRTEHAIPL